ncbi:hypothetical protein [Streptomyces sp. bgisy031]|uniref:hypothetical protein n=1 Tax=Streptomyces sp. bgisy031 TaxID=3413772 RepID=UPI003D712948
MSIPLPCETHTDVAAPCADPRFAALRADPRFAALRADPRFAALRADPRFAALRAEFAEVTRRTVAA